MSSCNRATHLPRSFDATTPHCAHSRFPSSRHWILGLIPVNPSSRALHAGTLLPPFWRKSIAISAATTRSAATILSSSWSESSRWRGLASASLISAMVLVNLCFSWLNIPAALTQVMFMTPGGGTSNSQVVPGSALAYRLLIASTPLVDSFGRFQGYTQKPIHIGQVALRMSTSVGMELSVGG